MITLWSSYGRRRPVLTLFAFFVAWKLLIALIVLTAPGIGYDTSTNLLFGNSHDNVASNLPQSMPSPWLKFVRWDAIYFTHMSDQGHVFEQEWAFGIGLSTTISWIATCLSEMGLSDRLSSTVAGVVLSHASHWLSVIQLWSLAKALVGEQKDAHRSLAFNAAALHIVSPAGVFLSAPCSESPFSFLSMSGFLSLVYALQYFDRQQALTGSANMIRAGFRFCAATMIRSNGILAGLPLLVEAITSALAVLTKGFTKARVAYLASLVAGGLLVGVGLVYPQFLAYQEYCHGREVDDRRPWCNRTLPSIFTFVQSHYWNVGPFRYWTLSNLPLFLLAAPSLWLLIHSAIDALRRPQLLLPEPATPSAEPVPPSQKRILMSLALPQLVLAVLALTSYHVQIITRISSGYPLWYIWLAVKLQNNPRTASPIVRWMVVYALVQAGLYACFLPPA